MHQSYVRNGVKESLKHPLPSTPMGGKLSRQQAVETNSYSIAIEVLSGEAQDDLALWKVKLAFWTAAIQESLTYAHAQMGAFACRCSYERTTGIVPECTV
jgi:hypothetical protein